MSGRSSSHLLTDKQRVAKTLIGDPDVLAYKFDLNTEEVLFLRVTRDEMRRVSALKREYIDPNRKLVGVPIAELANLLDSEPRSTSNSRPRFIFHTAFCASTFLARCLDIDGITVCLREPQILLDAANAKRLLWRSKSTNLDYRHLPKLALALLQRHAIRSEKLIIKPINSVNNIIVELIRASGSAPALMLYTDARTFVLSTLRKGEGGKQTVRSMFDLIRCDFPQLLNLQVTQTIHMTDLRVAMTLWRLQLEQAKFMLQQFSTDKVIASLYGERLIESPLEALQAANRFLQLGISSKRIEDIAGGDVRFKDAKNPQETFSKQERDRHYETLETFYGADLTDGLEWLIRNNPDTKLYPDLGAPLQF